MAEWIDDPTFDPKETAWVDDPTFKPEPKASTIGSAVRQGLQGATAGFSDEVAGGVEAIGQALGVEGAGGPMKDMALSDDGPTLDWEVLRDAYRKARNKERDALKKDTKDNPGVSMAANIAGSIASPVNKLTAGMSLAKGGALMGGAAGLGTSDSDSLFGNIADTFQGAAVGGGLGKAVDVAAPIVKSGAEKIGRGFKKMANQLAENATGATAKQSEKFADDAGEYLLEKGIVGFGDNAENIAEKANQAIRGSEETIDSSLRALDKQGVQVSQDKILETIQNRIAELAGDPSQADVVRKLTAIADDIIATGNSSVPLSAAEKIKRGFNKMASNWQDPEKGAAGKFAYRTYRDAVEESANAANPEIASQFKEAKGVFGKLNPIAEAAERRAQQLNQSPVGGLLDTAAVIGGAMGTDDPLEGGALGVATALARRKLAPRAASSIAATFNKVSQALLKSPKMAQIAETNPKLFQAVVLNFEKQMPSHFSSSIPRAAEKQDESTQVPSTDEKQLEKDDIFKKVEGSQYSQVLQNAAQKGDQSFNAANFVLSQRDPEYRKLLKGEQ